MKTPRASSNSFSGTIRVSKSSDYVPICNKGPRDSRLSWGARGILTYLLTKPDNWNPTVDDLINQAPEGKAAVRKMLTELKQFGYLKRERIRQENGKFIWQTTLYEVAQNEDFTLINSHKPCAENQHMVSPSPCTDLPSMVKPSYGEPVDIRSTEEEVLKEEVLNVGVGGVNTAREKSKLPVPPARPPQNIVSLISIPEPIRKALADVCDYPPDENNPRDQLELKKLLPFLGQKYPDAEMAGAGITETFRNWDRDSPPKLSQILREYPRMEKRARGNDNATTRISNNHLTPRQYAADGRRELRRELKQYDTPNS